MSWFLIMMQLSKEWTIYSTVRVHFSLTWHKLMDWIVTNGLFSMHEAENCSVFLFFPALTPPKQQQQKTTAITNKQTNKNTNKTNQTNKKQPKTELTVSILKQDQSTWKVKKNADFNRSTQNMGWFFRYIPFTSNRQTNDDKCILSETLNRSAHSWCCRQFLFIFVYLSVAKEGFILKNVCMFVLSY